MPGGMPATQTGTLEVTVIGPSGAPEKDVTVTALPVGANKGKNKKSTETGLAALDKHNYGTYHIVGRKKGFEPAVQEFVVLNSDKIALTLKLTAGADRKLYFEDAALERQYFSLLNEGITALESGNMAESERLIVRALEIKPSNSSADAYLYYGLALERQEKHDQAQESFKKAMDAANFMLSIIPNPKPMGMGMGGPGGMGGAPKPSGPSNREIFETIALNAEEQFVFIPMRRAEAAYEEKRYDEAIAFYDEAIKIIPGNVLLHSNKALVQIQADKMDEAVASINKAIELQPDNERVLQIKKVVDASIEKLALEKQNLLIRQANDLISEGNKLLESDASAALIKFEEANALTDEKQSMVWRQIGRAHAKLNQDTEAVAAFQKAIDLAPDNQIESFQMSLAQFYLDSKRTEEALDIVVAGSKDPEQRLMDLFTKNKNNQEAIGLATAALERVIKQNPSNFEAVFELGQIYYMDRNDNAAQELLAKYIENGKNANRIQTAKDFLTLIARRNKNN